MQSITIPLSDERLERLKLLARQAGVSPEELVRASVEVWLQRSPPDFDQAAESVLQKNAELYRRLS